MNKEFIPYEQALELKELGFDEYCFFDYNNECEITNVGIIPAPLHQQAFRWFREKHQCESSIIAMFLPYEHYKEYQFIITYTESEIVETNFNTYEEAELACLMKLIQMVKNK
jgi:hypothetical protein